MDIKFLETLTTKRLLTYKKKKYSHKKYMPDGYGDCSCSSCISQRLENEKYNETYEKIKEILSRRENV